MPKAKRADKRASIVLASLRAFQNILLAKGSDFDLKKIDPLYNALLKEVKKQKESILIQSKIPTKPRSAKKILEDLARGERLTPKLLEEIKRSQEAG